MKVWHTRAMVVAAGVAAACALMVFVLGAQEQTVGKYQVTAPDLVVNTTTGRIVDGTGKVVDAGVSAKADEVGRYQAAGWVKVTPKMSAWDAYGRPLTESQVEKGYVMIDTTNGQVLRRSVYESATTTVQTSEGTLITPGRPARKPMPP